MTDFIARIESECTQLGVSPVAVLQKAGLHGSSLWWRWKDGSVSPNLRSITSVLDQLESLRLSAEASVA